MKETKFISILSTLNKKEIQDFEFFLSSPLFNDRATLLSFYSEIKKYYPGFNDEEFTKENIYKKLYPGKKYNDELVRNMTSRLFRNLEKFLSFLSYQKDWFYQQYGLLRELNDRGHEKMFEKKFESIKNNILDTDTFDTEKFFEQNRLASISSYHYFTFKKTHDTAKNILAERESRIIEYFFADMLNVYSMMANQMLMYPERQYEFPMLPAIKDYIEQNESMSGRFYLQMLLNEVLLLKENDEKYLNDLKKILNKNSAKLSRLEKEKTYSLLINYLQDKIFKGSKSALAQRHELHKEIFANKAFGAGALNPVMLINAVSNSLTLGMLSDAENFIKDYYAEVNDYYRESTKHYCTALVDFYKKSYESTLQNLSKVDYDDISYKILVRTLTLMTYYSLSNIEGFYSQADSFKHFLDTNKKVNSYYHNIYTNFISFTSKLFKSKDDLNKFDFKNLRSELKNTNYIAKKQWLLEMIDELEKEKTRHN